MAKRSLSEAPPMGGGDDRSGNEREKRPRVHRRGKRAKEVPENFDGQTAEQPVIRLRRVENGYCVKSSQTLSPPSSLSLHLTMSTGAASEHDDPQPPHTPPLSAPNAPTSPAPPLPSEDEHKSNTQPCVIPDCTWNPPNEPTAQELAAHIRDEHNTGEYTAYGQELKMRGVGICPHCTEARPFTRAGYLWKHKCIPAAPRNPLCDQQLEVEEDEGEGVYRGLPWPTGVPHPPAGTPHPFTLAQHAPVIKTIPLFCRQVFGEAVAKTANALADAVQGGSDQEKQTSLVKFLSMSHCLRKPGRGGKRGTQKVRSNINSFIAAIEEGDWSPSAEPTSPAEASERRARDLDEARARSAEEIVGRGYLRKAAMRLRSDQEVKQMTPEVVAHLRAKFPVSSKTPITNIHATTDDDPNYITELNDFVEEMKSSFNGACGGPSSLMGDHIKAVLGLSGVARALHRVFSLLINGRFPAWSHPFVCASRLIALGEKMRPICMSEWLMRTASKLCERTVPSLLTTEFFFKQGKRYKVLQFGTAVKGGAEAAVSLAKTLVHEKGKNRVMIEKDGINAYNQTDRSTAVNDMAAAFPTTARWAKWAYGSPALLRTESDDTIEAACGVYQGDALGGRAHDASLQHALIAAAEKTIDEWEKREEEREKNKEEKHEDGEEKKEEAATAQPAADEEILWMLAFRDDVYLIAPPEIACLANHNVDVAREERTGVEENRAKTRAYCPREAHESDESHFDALIALENTYIHSDMISEDGIKMLGAPIGSDTFIDSFVSKIMNKYPNFLPRLKQMDPQKALLLLRDCHLPIVTHIIRMLHPEHTTQHAHSFDTQIINTYSDITHDTNITLQHNDYHNPFKLSGVGLRSVETLAPIAHYASQLQSSQLLATIFSAIGESTGAAEAPPDPPEPPAQHTPPHSPPLSPLFFNNDSDDDSIVPATDNDDDSIVSATDSDGETVDLSRNSTHPHEAQQPDQARVEESNSSFSFSSPSFSSLSGHNLDQDAQQLQQAPEQDNTHHPVIADLTAAWRSLNDSQPELNDIDSDSAIQFFPSSEQLLLEGFGGFAAQKLQNLLTKMCEQTKYRAMEDGRTAEEAARARATKSYGSCAAMLAKPTSAGTTIPPSALRFAAQNRLGTAVFGASKCACGVAHPTVAHALSCKKLRGRFVRHDVIVNLLAKMCCEAGFTTTTEVMVVEGKQKRMDLVITLPTGRVWIDVSFVNPLAPSYLSDKDPKATREKAKVTRWGNDARRRGVTFVPFIIDIYGGIGGQAKEWLGEIAKAAAIRNMVEIDSRDITPATWQGQYRWELVSQIGAAVAHANYCMVEEAALKSEWPRAPTRMLYGPLWARAPRGKMQSEDRKGKRVRRELFDGSVAGLMV